MNPSEADASPMMLPQVSSTWVQCPMASCTFRVRVFGERERRLPCTFYKLPTMYPRDLPRKLHPSAIRRRQRAHLRVHEAHVAEGSPEHHHLLTAQRLLASKRFRAKGSSARELELSRRRRRNERRRKYHEKVTRLFHLNNERHWKPFEERLRESGFRPTTLPAAKPGGTRDLNVMGHLTRDAFHEAATFAGCGELQIQACFDVVQRVLDVAERGKVTPAGAEIMRAAGFEVSDRSDLPSTKALRTILAFRGTETMAAERTARANRRDDLRPRGGTHSWPGWNPKAEKGSGWDHHDRILGFSSVGKTCGGGHHLARRDAVAVFDALLSSKVRHRVFLEVGFGTGYMVAEGLARGLLAIIGLETPGNGSTVMQTFEPDPRVVLYEAYGEHFCLDSMLRAKVTSMSCIVGDPGLTEHMVRLFLSSPYACELAYLLPVHACDAESLLRRSGKVTIKRLTVSLARSSGVRTVVVAIKTRNPHKPAGNYNISCPCSKFEVTLASQSSSR